MSFLKIIYLFTKKLLSNIQVVLIGFFSFVDVICFSSFSSKKQIHSSLYVKEHDNVRLWGNGNSLQDIINEKSNQLDFDHVVVNRFVLSNFYVDLKPKYYVLADDHFFSTNEGQSILMKIRDCTTWEMVLFVPFSRQHNKSVRQIFEGSSVKVVTFNQRVYQGPQCVKKLLFNLQLSMPVAQNVMVAAIYLSIILGYSNIELFGVEHSWTQCLIVNHDNQVCLVNPHFYDTEAKQSLTFKEIQGTDYDWPMHLVLRSYARMFESYWELKDYATSKQCVILNCTPNSFIDAFKKK